MSLSTENKQNSIKRNGMYSCFVELAFAIRIADTEGGMAMQGFPLLLGVIGLQIICVLGSKCNWHYFQHYEQKGCKAVLGRDGCPERFQCKELSSDDYKTCVHKGKIYRDRDQIHDLGPCDSCRCEVDHGTAFIECAAVDCPDWEPKNKSCYMGYEPNTCCPTEMCPAGDSSKICRHNNKKYKIGQIIETSEPCETCLCTEDWTGESGPGCSSADCLTGIYAQKIRKGCLPIYSEKSCCLSEMYCNGLYGAVPESVDDEVKDDYCSYRGSYYKKGSIAYLKTDKCITCSCITPPDFTCLRKTCPSKPRPDCKPVYGLCCPKYECP